MKTINLAFMTYFHDGWSGLGQCDVGDECMAPFVGLDGNDRHQMRTMIRNVVLPEFRKLSDETKAHAKEALAFCLSRPAGKFSFDRLLRSDCPPFRIPDEPRNYFLWCWQECFPGESYQKEFGDQIKVVDDVNAAQGIDFTTYNQTEK